MRSDLFQKYLDRIDKGDLEPIGPPLPYSQCPDIGTIDWAMPIAGIMIRDDLRELANSLNRWWRCLRRWNAWIDVLADFETDERWALNVEFVEALSFFCLFQPVSQRDRLVYVATQALHQARQTADPSHRDRLADDPKPGERRAKFVGRSEAEAQLARIAKFWPKGLALVELIRHIDDVDHRDKTGNFRNLASHKLPPNIDVGITGTVKRSRTPATAKTQSLVTYSLGGTGPLDSRQLAAANLVEFRKAEAAFEGYVDLLDEALAAIKAAAS